MILSLFTMLPTNADAAADSSAGLSLAYGFEGGTAGEALGTDFLVPTASAWYTVAAAEGLSFAADPANVENTVVKGNGVITFADKTGHLWASAFQQR